MTTELENLDEKLVEIVMDKDAKSEVKKAKRIKILLFLAGAYATIAVFFILFFLFFEAFQFFAENSLTDFLFGQNWAPLKAENDVPQYGAFNIILGSILVTLGAMVISIPLGILTAIYIAELAPPRVSRFMKSAVEILSGIPSIIFGYFGRIILALWLSETLDIPPSGTWLAGSIILGFMALPTIVSVSEDAISSVPREMREGSLAMGSTKWQTIIKVVLPAAISGITAGIMLGIGRAIGETMAVVMITGNKNILPKPLTDIFSGVRTMTGTIALEMGEALGTHRQALFALAVVLFIITFMVNTFAHIIMVRLKNKFQATQKKRRFSIIPELEGKNRNKAKKILGFLLIGSLAVYGILFLFNFDIYWAFYQGDIGLDAFFGAEVILTSIGQRVMLNGLFLIISLVFLMYFHSYSELEEKRKINRIIRLIFLIGLISALVLVFNSWFTILEVEGALLYTILIVGVIIGFITLYRYINPRGQQIMGFGVVIFGTFIVLSTLIIIILNIFINGIPAIFNFTNINGIRVLSGIRLDFFTETPRDLGRRGGIFPAIVGTLLLTVGSILFAIPLGIGAGVYLAEYATDNKITRIIRNGIDNLNGTPSIVFGLFGFAFFILFLGMPVSMLVGQIVLMMMILPTIIRTTEEALKAIPQGFREGSLALGATKWQTIKKVTLPSALPGVITGFILGMGRAIGETAPIMFVAVVFSQRYLPTLTTDPVMALTFHLFVLLKEVPNSEVKAAGTAVVLLMIVLALYSIGIIVRNYFRKKKKW